MALVKASLKSALEAFFAAPPDGGGDVAASRSACAAQWAGILSSYASTITPPSTTVAAASSALQAALTSAMGGTGVAAFDSALSTWATSIGGGMAPAFVATPPAASSIFATQCAIMRTDHAAAAQAWADAIDEWIRTGTSVPSGGGAAVAWA